MQFRSGEILHGLDDRNNPASLQSVRFEKCAFLNSVASFNRQNDRRSRFKDIHLKDCEIQDCYIGPAIFEDCTVENLKNSGDLLVVWGAVFRRVKLSGNIGRFKTNSAFGPDGVMKPSLNEPFDEFRDYFYRATDWALDISAARFTHEFDVSGIPGRLIRRDPETQVLVTREKVLQPGMMKRISDWNEWRDIIEVMIEFDEPDIVLAVPLGAAKGERASYSRGLKELRELDLAEPD